VSNAILEFAKIAFANGDHTDAAQAERHLRTLADFHEDRAAWLLAKIHDERGEPDMAAELRREAAEYAQANLTNNGKSILTAYGPKGIDEHLNIVRGYADLLDAHMGPNATELRDWADSYKPARDSGPGGSPGLLFRR
jgi:hypothetical protein